jgi:MFS family permease
VRAPLIALLCATTFASTFSFGAFPALLPDLGRGGLADWELGLVAGAFGFARMLADVPVGMLITHHLRQALLVAPLLLLAGLGILTLGGGTMAALLLGRVTMGVAHALGMVAGLTAILRSPTRSLSAALNAVELSAMLGILGGTLVLGTLPAELSWNQAMLLTAIPQVLGVLLIPAVLRALSVEEGAGSRRSASPAGARRETVAPITAGVVLAFATGGSVAVAYATLEHFLIPLRGSREFGLSRSGVAGLLLTVQVADIACLLPVGVLADRLGSRRVLGVMLLAFGVAAGLIAFGDFTWLVVGCALFGVGMSSWTLPLALLRRDTPASLIGWRTALYRVGVDGGMFLGPFLAGLLIGRWSALLPALLVAALLALGVTLLGRREASRPLD